MMQPKTKKRIVKISMISFAGIVIVIAYIYMLARGREISRDMQRLSDMQKVQSGFELMYQHNFTYALAGCKEGNLVNQCALGAYVPEIVYVKDPGEFAYTVTKTPDTTGFELTFTLEKGSSVLAAGEHKLTNHGIE